MHEYACMRGRAFMGRTSIFKKEGEQMEVRFYKFTKKENSTMIPANPFVVFECIIKNESAIVNPTIEIVSAMTENPHEWNYCFIPDFGRYYWVTEWAWSNRKWVASLNVDVLATYKTEIGNFDGYILRSSYQYDGNIVDTLFPTNTNMITSMINCNEINIFNLTYERGTFIVGCVDKSPVFGSISYYALSYYNLRALVSALLDDSILTGNRFNPDDCSLALQKSLVDPLSYIKTCIYIPYSYSDYVQGEQQSLSIWDWTVPATCKKVSGSYVELDNEVTINIPKHPQATTRGNYCNVAPYTNMKLMFAPFGEIDLDTMYLKDKSVLKVRLGVDMTNGLGMLTIKADNEDYVIHRSESQVGVNIALSQVTRDYLGFASSMLNSVPNAIGGFLTGGSIGAVTGSLSGIANGLQAITPRVSSGTPSSGAFINYYYGVYIVANFYQIVEDDNAHHGRPLCMNGQLSNYPGYLLILNGDVEAVATREELNQIKSYLEGGFYYE